MVIFSVTVSWIDPTHATRGRDSSEIPQIWIDQTRWKPGRWSPTIRIAPNTTATRLENWLNRMVKWRLFSLCIIYVTAVILRGKNQKIPRFEVVTWWIGRSTVNEVVANHQWSNIRGPAIFWGVFFAFKMLIDVIFSKMYPKISQNISNIGKFHEHPTLERENRHADFLQSSSADAHLRIFFRQSSSSSASCLGEKRRKKWWSWNSDLNTPLYT